MHPEDKPRVVAEMSKAVDSGSGTLEYRFQRQDGTYQWMRDEWRLDSEHEPPEPIGYWVDITARQEAAEAQRRANDDLEARVTKRTAEVSAINEALTAQVAERKRVETALRVAEQQTREQRDELEQIYRTAPVGLALLDLNLRYVRVNDQSATAPRGGGLMKAPRRGLSL